MIKADELNAKAQPTTLVALADNVTPSIQDQAMNAGFALIISKPYSSQELKEIIDKWQELNIVNKLVFDDD